MKDLPEIVKKYGVNGVLCIALFWMNGRLDKVEQRLYDCYESKPVIMNSSYPQPIKIQDEKIAILPDKKSYKRHTSTERES